MLTLHIYSDVIDPNTEERILDCYITDIVKNIIRDENLTTNLESSSSIWKITLPHDCENSLRIIQLDDLHAELYDGNKYFFTGYVSTTFNYTIDQYGQNAVQITLEDNGTHLLKAPYAKQESEVVKGKFSSITTGDLGVVQQICSTCGITYVNNIITDTTQVKSVVEAAESCETLLKSLCKEMGYAYSFNELGQLYLLPLSTTETLDPDDPDPSVTPIISSGDLYGSINLVRKARTYRGSRIKWTELGTKNDVLIYREEKGLSNVHPDCYIPISNGTYWPENEGEPYYYQANDILNGSEIFSIDTLYPEYDLDPDNCGIVSITRHSTNTVSVLVTGTAQGYITKLQADADITYVKSHNVTYGEGDQISDALHEEECRWIHDQNSAKKYANFIAQYDKYCSAEFSFITDEELDLGQIVYLNENVYTEFGNYMMVVRRTRTLHEYDDTDRDFTGKWTYRAVSMAKFNLNKPILIEENTSTPPTTSYTQEMPDISDLSGIQLTTDQSFLIKDLRSSATQTLHIYAHVIGDLSGITVTANYSSGEAITVTTVTADEEWTITVPENKNVQGVNITASVNGTAMNTIYVSFNDKTQYYKFLGNYSSNPTESQANSVILVHDFYVNTTNGKTIECTGRTETSSVPVFTWAEMPLTADNANKFLTALESATQAGIALESMSNPNTVSWFNTIISAKAVIDNLFSRYITVLNGGSIHSDSYSDVGTKVNTNPGFWLGSNGQLLCDSGQMTNLSISGSSVFGGDFDCDVIKTADGSVSVRGTAQATDISKYQSRQLATAIRSLSLDTGLQPARIQNASGSYQQAVAYVSFLIDEGSHNTEYKVSFFDSAASPINVTNMFSCTTNRESGPSIHYQKGRGISPPEYYTYSNVSFTIEFIQGANRTLQLTLPNGPSGLATGMIYKDSSGYVRIV